MNRIVVFLIFVVAQVCASASQADERLDALYSAKAIVTGTGVKNRQPGFRDCLDRVILRVSGDQRLLKHSQMEILRAQAGTYVRSFSYRDRLAGKPVHDEQGTYDRPHDLTCTYEKAVVDGLLAELGSRPWLADRPKLLVALDVKRDGPSFRVSRGARRDQDMRESFENAAAPLAMLIAFPAAADQLTAATNGVLQGSLVWSDPDLGWVATWKLRSKGKMHRWRVSGVNYDEAFRVAMRGAAQILSGNGQP